MEPLSARELEVLRLIASGKSNAEVARTLVIAISTVKTHTNSIFGKLQVTSRTQAIALARDLATALAPILPFHSHRSESTRQPNFGWIYASPRGKALFCTSCGTTVIVN